MAVPAPSVLAVGGSAGGVDALQRFVAELPADLPAAVLVTLHLGPGSPGLLREILARSSTLPVLGAQDGQPVQEGSVVVARPDAHLLLVGDVVRLGQGARENHHRPSIDVLFRSVALARGPGAVGVVLTGMLGDGAAGLLRIARHGGKALVQDPDDAQFPSMPNAALAAVPDSAVLPLPALAHEAVRLLRGAVPAPLPASAALAALDEAELAAALGLPGVLPDGSLLGEPSPFSCPECGGVLREVEDTPAPRFRCRTGHAYAGSALLHGQDETVEAALSTALRALEEREELSLRLADSAGATGRSYSRSHFRARAEEARRSAAVLRGLLLQRDGAGEPPSEQVAT